MTFSEIIKGGQRWLYETEEYEYLGIQVIDNTTEEILAVTKEMELRMMGEWSPTQEDIELQAAFHNLLRPYDLAADIVTTIGSDFLRNNKFLIT
jgi:putative glycosyltransferase (TIGR04372 family)